MLLKLVEVLCPCDSRLVVIVLRCDFVYKIIKIIIHYLTQKQKKIKFKPRIKLNHNIYNEAYLQVFRPIEFE